MGWVKRKLGEICEIIAGQAPPSKHYNNKGNGIPFLTVNSFGVVYPKVERWTTKCLKESKEGDVLFSVAGSLGSVNLGINGCITRSIFALRPLKEAVLQKFLYYSLKKYGTKIASMGSGTAQRVINIKQISEFQIPLPPLPIQQKIVKILDTVQEAVEVQDKIIEKTKELKKSLMADLFKYGGPSFRKGRKLKKTEIGEIPENWEVVRLGEVVNDLTNGFPAGERDEMGILQLRMDSITSDGKINLNAGVKIPKKKGLEIYLLQKGDILFNNTNSIDLVGKTALYKGEFKECVFSNHITRIRVNPHRTLPEWIFYILFRYWELKLFKNLAVRRVGQADISRNTLKNINIPLPPLPEQQEIAEILQTVDQKIEIEQKKKELYEELFKTLLNKIMNQEIDVENIRLEG